MKRELTAVVLLLLLLAASFVNLRYYDGLTGRVEAELRRSQECVEQNDFDGAREHYHKAEELWLGAKPFTHIFIRHAEIDSTVDAFYDLRQLLDEESREECAAAYEKIYYHLESIDGMEHPRLGSIF